MANGAGSVAAAAAGITAHTGSLLGDLTEQAGGFLKGVQEEKERKEKQALEDAIQALNVRAQDERERSALIEETRLQGALDESIRATDLQDENVDAALVEDARQADQTEAVNREFFGPGALATGRAQEANAARLEQDRIDDNQEEEVATGALRDRLIEKGVSREVAESYNFQGAEAALADIQADLDREALNQRNANTNRVQTRLSINTEIQTIQESLAAVARVREQIIPNRNEEMQAVIDEGFFTVWTDPETGEQVDPRTLGSERRTQLILQMDEDQKSALVDQRRTSAGLRTTAEEEAAAAEQESVLNEQLQSAVEELNQLRVQEETEERDPGTGTVQPAGGAAGAAVPGDPDVQPIAANPFSPAGDGFIRSLQDDVVGASNMLKAMQITADATPDVRPIALEDITARLTLAQRTVEDIHAEAQEIEEERAEAAEEEALAEEDPVDARRRVMRERIAAGQPALSDGDAAGAIDPSLEALEKQVQEGAGAREDQEQANTVAVSELKNSLATLEGQVDFESAKSAVMQLLRLGETRRDSLLAIRDVSLRIHVANVIPNRIAG